MHYVGYLSVKNDQAQFYCLKNLTSTVLMLSVIKSTNHLNDLYLLPIFPKMTSSYMFDIVLTMVHKMGYFRPEELWPN